jgi:hypothetical protein
MISLWISAEHLSLVPEQETRGNITSSFLLRIHTRRSAGWLTSEYVKIDATTVLAFTFLMLT